MALQGISVLVTRPEGQADGLISAITALGGKANHYPVMAITELDAEKYHQTWQDCKQQIMALDQFQHVIFISGNAVNFGLEWIEQYWPQLPIGIQWYGIGQSTIAKMLQAGLTVANEADGHQGAMNSEQLLCLPSLQQLTEQKVLIVRGIGGREYLAEQLAQRGATVSYAQCYQRAIVDRPSGELRQLFDSKQINAVCINSGESLDHLCTLIGPDYLVVIKKLLLIVPGQRVAALAEAKGFNDIAIADNASDNAMASALEQAVRNLK